MGLRDVEKLQLHYKEFTVQWKLLIFILHLTCLSTNHGLGSPVLGTDEVIEGDGTLKECKRRGSTGTEHTWMTKQQTITQRRQGLCELTIQDLGQSL